MGVRIQAPLRSGNDSAGFSGCPTYENIGRSMGSDTKIEKWRKSHLLLCFFLVLFSGLGLVSGEKWDGVIVTQADYQALQSIKHELVDPKGVLKSWNDTSNGACSGEWIGIKCVNGQVIGIQLPWKGLGGQISQKIGQLQALQRLSLHDNFLVGPVPISLGFLPNLRGVYLFNNRLSGSIPPSIGNCLVLQTLDLSNNELTGMIPPSLANSRRLYRLKLSSNGLSGSIPSSLSQNPYLTVLALQNNNLSGSIPDSWISKNNKHSYNLQSLNLSYNRINGNIPEEFRNLLKLKSLDLSNNAITGTFPLSLTNLSSLETINLENNNLDSQIPESVENFRNLSVLNLSNNKFKGQIPGTIGNITTLSILDLSHNNLSMEIPNSLVNLSNLDSFNVSYNNLSGTVPSVLASRFSSSSFIGNIQLCGYNSSTTCPSLQPENLPPPEKNSRKLSSKDIILISSGALLIVLLILCCVLMCCLIRKKAASRSSKPSSVLAKATPAAGNIVESGGETGGKLVHFDGPFVFTADDLLCATAEIMGKSNYGTAYKATLEDNNVVAVKRLREKITKPLSEFESEVSELGKIRHPNILALRAYYLGPKGEKLLVYDYMPNGSLASFLHARGPETNIQWPQRMAIVMGVTQGLCYLHTEQDIVHGNLTSSNILLDEENHPEIADVGLSRLMTSAANTNIIATAGTMGYRAPELSKIKNATTKTDVFSLGVILLELLTGKSPSEATDGLDLPQWVASTVKDEWTNEVFDVELMRDAPNIGDELLNTLKLALHCVDPSPTARPEAHQVLQKLEEIKPEMDGKVILPTSGGETFKY